MVSLFKGSIEIHELYNTFKHQYDVLHDHNTLIRESNKDFDIVVEWQNHIKDRPNDLPLTEKLKCKKTEVTIETWEIIFDVVESNIKDG